uniref:Uncharacterized protein n=1 Tax=Anguilla anguilla TaxID=7936 RepID=A0A0E9QBG2_ANGAN
MKTEQIAFHIFFCYCIFHLKMGVFPLCHNILCFHTEQAQKTAM